MMAWAWWRPWHGQPLPAMVAWEFKVLPPNWQVGRNGSDRSPQLPHLSCFLPVAIKLGWSGRRYQTRTAQLPDIPGRKQGLHA